MSSEAVSLVTMADDIRMVFSADRSMPEQAIENYMNQRFQGFQASRRRELLKQLIDQFKAKGEGPGTPPCEHPEPGDLSRLLSLVLGEKAYPIEVSSPQLMEKVTFSLNTLFDTLNDIIRVINLTLLGEKIELKTIRHIIGSELVAKENPCSLQTYLDRIREAFLIAHHAFREAVQNKLTEILSSLDPEHIASEKDAGFRFGPLRKAELFVLYQQRFEACKRSLESGRLIEQILREFERICQKRYAMGAGRIG